MPPKRKKKWKPVVEESSPGLDCHHATPIYGMLTTTRTKMRERLDMKDGYQQMTWKKRVLCILCL